MTLTNFIQLLVTGTAMGAIYALTAKGLFIAHLTTNRVNFGQGDFLMAASFLSLAAIGAGLPLPLAIVAVVTVLSLMGWGLERFAVRPLDRFGAGRAGGALAWILTTAGMALILQNTAELLWGKSSQYSPPLFSDRRDNVITVGQIGFFLEELLIILAAFAAVGAFWWALFRTRWGRDVYTVAFNPDAASLLGIDVRRTVTSVWIIAALLAAVSGILVGPLVTVHPHMGLIFTIKALAVASLGGFANPIGILVGGILFGVAEALANYWDSKYGDLYPLLFVMAMLVLKPSGIFGESKADIR
jgi:branched-chain amino acid transport system permease protein